MILYQLTVDTEQSVNYPALTEILRRGALGAIEYVSGSWLICVEDTTLEEWYERLKPAVTNNVDHFLVPIDVKDLIPVEHYLPDPIKEFLYVTFPQENWLKNA